MDVTSKLLPNNPNDPKQSPSVCAQSLLIGILMCYSWYDNIHRHTKITKMISAILQM